MPYSVEASIKAKNLTMDNYLDHPDEMTDEERKAWPDITDRSRAEFLRDF